MDAVCNCAVAKEKALASHKFDFKFGMHTHAGSSLQTHYLYTRNKRRSSKCMPRAILRNLFNGWVIYFLNLIKFGRVTESEEQSTKQVLIACREANKKNLAIKERDLIDLGPFKVSPLGLGAHCSSAGNNPK